MSNESLKTIDTIQLLMILNGIWSNINTIDLRSQRAIKVIAKLLDGEEVDMLETVELTMFVALAITTDENERKALETLYDFLIVEE